MNALAQRTERALAAVDPASRGRFGGWQGPELPRVSPATEAEAAEFLRAASADGLVVLPMGNGSKLDWCPVPKNVHVLLSTARMVGPVAYEPAEGVLSVRAGTQVAEIATLLAEDDRRIAPDVPFPDRATVGGAFAAGQGGADRLRRGTWRDSILGARVLGADGTVTTSGGRLVKNVTGYDLFRLHGGAHGALGCVLELSLRLYPNPPAAAWLEWVEEDARAALRSLAELQRAPIQSTRLLAFQQQGEWRAAVHLEGRPRALAAALAEATSRLPGATTLRDEQARTRANVLRDGDGCDGDRGAHASWTLVEVHVRPSETARALDVLRRTAGGLGIGVRFLVEPALGRIALSAEGAPSETAMRSLAKAVEWERFPARWIGAPASLRGELAGPPPPGAEVMRRLIHEFDPDGRFARGRLHPSL